MPRAKNPNKKSRNPLLGYKNFYDPTAEGYGSPDQWKTEFKFRMGLDVAREKVGSWRPLDILKVVFESGWTYAQKWAAIKKAWRAKMREYYPEQRQTNWDGVYANVGSREMYDKVQGAYEILENEYKRYGVC